MDLSALASPGIQGTSAREGRLAPDPGASWGRRPGWEPRARVGWSLIRVAPGCRRNEGEAWVVGVVVDGWGLWDRGGLCERVRLDGL